MSDCGMKYSQYTHMEYEQLETDIVFQDGIINCAVP